MGGISAFVEEYVAAMISLITARISKIRGHNQLREAILAHQVKERYIELSTEDQRIVDEIFSNPAFDTDEPDQEKIDASQR